MAEAKTPEKGGISVETEHIFPIIKKWLYSDKEIFLREIVSNATDAVTKLTRLSSLGEAKDIDTDAFRVDVTLDVEGKTITVRDNGIGMTGDELRRYICQMALSGALEFIEKYEGTEKDAAGSGIIGHFGLGFYSAFMVSDTVDVISRSYTGSDGVKWICDDAGQYEITPFDGAERGTTVVMHISEEGEEYLNEGKLRSILDKYCAFMPVPIFFEVVGKTEKKDDKDVPAEPAQINETKPLWQKAAGDCTDDEYKAFYKKVFGDYRDPLFWIHINADYPLNFKGILFFPKMSYEYQTLEGQVKLYYNQVFVADNIKEVIPEYLLMMRGVLDCPELPLNVSRSYLQNSGYVAKISAHIVKKVADKLVGMFNTEREQYEGLWEDIKTFVKYSCLCDRKFYDRAKDALLFPLTDGKKVTLAEYLEAAKEKHEKTVYYANDTQTQAQYISMYKNENIDVVLLDKLIDAQFITFMEQNNEGVKFARVDAAIAPTQASGESEKNDALEKLFRDAAGNDKLEVNCRALKDESVPAILNVSEESRRFSDMMKMYSPEVRANMPAEAAVLLNTANPTIKKLMSGEGGEHDIGIAKQILMLATIAQRQLTAEELTSFLSDSYKMLENL